MPLTTEIIQRATSVSQNRSSRQRLLWASLTLMVVASSCVTNHYSVVWSSEKHLWEYSVRANNKDMHAWTNLATISSNRGQFDRALEEYDMALELNPTDFECRYNRAVTLSEAARINPYYEIESSIKEYQQLVIDFPEVHQLPHDLGSLYMRQDHYEAAVEAFKRALEINPKSAKSHYNLANSYKALGKDQKGLKSYKNARIAQTTPNGAYLNGANLQLSLEKNDKTKKYTGPAPS
eukprot:FR740538.1.p1 GENE.FR740538.1~~FR740538.1.p1  ORF type:complete len:236 (+),score=4.59 FR740538.1:70-777(+)